MEAAENRLGALKRKRGVPKALSATKEKIPGTFLVPLESASHSTSEHLPTVSTSIFLELPLQECISELEDM